MQQVCAVTHETVARFVQCHLPPGQLVRSDALASLTEIGKTQHHAARVTPPDMAGEWLPWVHIAIGNLKAFLLGTYHGVSPRYLQEYLTKQPPAKAGGLVTMTKVRIRVLRPV
ncbi:ISXO2-like transposase domain-containing protein [Nitrosomonas halophila]|uniref:ISXO2-like transposase domain-containing protein n=1 Tax=Nitrosomonas halophila TaxID=44576 RepID=A0A1H3PG52_9PROT|nr:ISXO2-like transposase domain-containing protein [Nitrosomonas halophila]